MNSAKARKAVGVRSRPPGRAARAALACLATAVTLAACTGGNIGRVDRTLGATEGRLPAAALTVGTTDPVVSLDPAGSNDSGSALLENSIYQYLLAVPAGASSPQPDAAEKCGFADPTTYRCTLKPDLAFANGDPLTAQDVAFSFRRVVRIDDPEGPAALLRNMASVTAEGPDTVVFRLTEAGDRSWPFVLGSAAGAIVDSRVFPADALLPDRRVVGSGPYRLASYRKNERVGLVTDPHYSGPDAPQTPSITLRYAADSGQLARELQRGRVDVAWHGLDPAEVTSLQQGGDANGVHVVTGSAQQLRFLVFDLKTMPGANDAQKLAIRHAVAYSIDRRQLADSVFHGSYQPAYSMVTPGSEYALHPFQDAYGSAPDTKQAAAALRAAGVPTPLPLTLDYTTDHYGSVSAEEFGQIAQQLEATQLFTVTVTGTPWTTYDRRRLRDAYPIYQLARVPDVTDAAVYLSQLLTGDAVGGHYCDPGAVNRPCDLDRVQPLLTTLRTGTDAARAVALQQLQKVLATGTMPYLPLLAGKQVAVTRGNVSGVQETLDTTSRFRLWLLRRYTTGG